jgi:dATP pyrophosphohydrolase
MKLDSFATVPRDAFPGAPWPDTVFVVPEHALAVDIGEAELRLSAEHDCFEWLSYDDARKRLTWDSNRNALWELRERLSAMQRDA